MRRSWRTSRSPEPQAVEPNVRPPHHDRMVPGPLGEARAPMRPPGARIGLLHRPPTAPTGSWTSAARWRPAGGQGPCATHVDPPSSGLPEGADIDCRTGSGSNPRAVPGDRTDDHKAVGHGPSGGSTITRNRDGRCASRQTSGSFGRCLVRPAPLGRHPRGRHARAARGSVLPRQVPWAQVPALMSRHVGRRERHVRPHPGAALPTGRLAARRRWG